MVALTPPICDFGWKAPDFRLPATDGNTYALHDLMGEKGLLIAFICNHCPFVKAIKTRLIRDADELSSLGINVVAINPNDASVYAEDSFENMMKEGYPFPYLHDETQEVAKAYDAICTPDFFGFNKDFELQYRGRLDESRMQPASPDVRRDLMEAMKQVAATNKGPEQQIASMGCSIKWKT